MLFLNAKVLPDYSALKYLQIQKMQQIKLVKNTKSV